MRKSTISPSLLQQPRKMVALAIKTTEDSSKSGGSNSSAEGGKDTVTSARSTSCPSLDAQLSKLEEDISE